MASFNDIVNKVTQSGKDAAASKVEGLKDQVNNEIEDAIGSLNQTALNLKNKGTAAAEGVVNKLKSKVDEAGSTVKGMIPGSVNGYVSRTLNEKQKSFNASEGSFSGVDFNNFIIPYDNPLFSYHNYTWNFSLYTMAPDEYEFFLDSGSSDVSKYIIAQSGVTGKYSINNVKMTVAGPATPGLTSNFSMNNLTMEVIENGGMSLFDDIVVLSNELGYKKFMDVPMILELNFVGYDQNTGIPQVIESLNRKWGVRINNIAAAASPSGGSMVYTFTMAGTRGGIMENRDWTLKETYTCNTGSFGEFIQQLQEHLNKISTDQYGYLRYRYGAFANDEYFKLMCAPELANMTINYDSKQSPEVNQSKSGASASKNFTCGSDVPVSRVIDDVLDCCMPLNESTDKRRQFVNIIPVSKYVGYDPVRDTSVYKNYFYVLKYKIGDVTSKDDLEHESFNLEYFMKNADKIIDEKDPAKIPKINAKRYDHHFSGLSSEIINLDLKFDQGFNIATVRNPQTQIDKSNSSGTHTAETLELAGQEYSVSDTAELWKKSQSLLREQQNGKQLSDEEKQFIRDAQGVAQSRVMPTEQDTDRRSTNFSVAANLPKYIEDFRKDFDLTVEGTNGIGIPRVDSVPTEPTNIKSTNSGSKGDNSSDDELERRLIRDNYYNRSFLAKLDMKVVGDPFWLGWGDYSYVRYLDRAVQGKDLELNAEDIHFANYMTTETYLLLNLKPIVAISDTTGILEINKTSVFAQTFYRVNRVVSEFDSSGKFTQQITGGLVMRSLRRIDQQNPTTESAETIKKNGRTN